MPRAERSVDEATTNARLADERVAEAQANAKQTARELLDRGAELARRTDNPPLVRAVVLDTLGEIERSHLNYDAAEHLLNDSAPRRPSRNPGAPGEDVPYRDQCASAVHARSFFWPVGPGNPH